MKRQSTVSVPFRGLLFLYIKNQEDPDEWCYVSVPFRGLLFLYLMIFFIAKSVSGFRPLPGSLISLLDGNNGNERNP